MKIKYKILIFFQIYFCILNDSWAEVKIEKVVPPIIDNITPVVPDITNPSATDKVAPVVLDNLNTSTTDNTLDKTVIDSKINASMKGDSFDPELKKISANNYAVGISFGKKFEANNLLNFSEKYSEYFNNKFILAELFYNKNINKKTSQKNIEIDSLQGFRSGFGSNFNNIHLVITSNIFSANLSPNPSNNNKNLLLLFGVTGGYKLNKKIDLRLNIISSFGQKVRAFNNNFNNFDLSMAINF